MAMVENPRKNFNFSIIVEGMNPFLAQEVEIPEIEIEPVMHGDTNHDIKTAGRVKIGMIKIRKLSTAQAPDNLFWDWMKSIQNVFLGGGTIPAFYKRTIVIEQFGTDGISVINVHIFTGCWPTKRAAISLNRTTSENTIEEIDFCVDKLDQF